MCVFPKLAITSTAGFSLNGSFGVHPFNEHYPSNNTQVAKGSVFRKQTVSENFCFHNFLNKSNRFVNSYPFFCTVGASSQCY